MKAVLLRRGNQRTTQQDLDAGHQFHHFEWFCKIVVRPNFQSKNFVDDLTPCGQHENRNHQARLAEISANIKAILSRQHDVENYQIAART